jgi:glycosyltransferase involved in cell wall biosynthesis
MSCGLPVVYSASGGVPELVGDAGRGVPAELSWEIDIPPDPQALADAVEQVARDREALSARARIRAVAQLDVSHWLARHRDIFGATA